MGRPCRCCCAYWTHRRIAVPSGEHVQTYKLTGGNEQPKLTACKNQGLRTNSLWRWFGQGWGVSGIVTPQDPAAGIGVFINQDATDARRFRTGGWLDTLTGPVAVGPAGEFALLARRNTDPSQPTKLYSFTPDGVLQASRALTFPGQFHHGITFDAETRIWVTQFSSAPQHRAFDWATLTLQQLIVDPNADPSLEPFGLLATGPFRNHYDRDSERICCFGRIRDVNWTSSPGVNPISSAVGWIGCGGGYAWRIDPAFPSVLLCYSQSDLSSGAHVASVTPFPALPTTLLAADVDESGRIAVMGRTAAESNLAVITTAGEIITQVDCAAFLDPVTLAIERENGIVLCWGPRQDEVIVGFFAATDATFPPSKARN